VKIIFAQMRNLTNSQLNSLNSEYGQDLLNLLLMPAVVILQILSHYLYTVGFYTTKSLFVNLFPLDMYSMVVITCAVLV